MAKREHIPARLRHEVFKRDNYRCRECGATNNDTTLEIDHIVPVAKGGSNNLSNLQTLCKACNRAKHTRTWVGGRSDSIRYESKSKVANYKPKPMPYFNKKGVGALKEDRKNRELWNCPNCRKTYAKTAKKCPHCGLNLSVIDENDFFFKENNIPMKKFLLLDELEDSNDDFIYELRITFLPSGLDSKDEIIKYLFDNFTLDKIEYMINTTKKYVPLNQNKEMDKETGFKYPSVLGNTCIKCGRTINAHEKYCSKCKPREITFKYCSKCGKKILKNALRCKYCGYSFGKYSYNKDNNSNTNFNYSNSNNTMMNKKSFIERLIRF